VTDRGERGIRDGLLVRCGVGLGIRFTVGDVVGRAVGGFRFSEAVGSEVGRGEGLGDRGKGDVVGVLVVGMLIMAFKNFR